MIGLLWYDADKKRSMKAKIAQAAQRYREKFGRFPNVCYINPADGESGTVTIDDRGITILTAKNTLRHHYWVGERNDLDGDQGRREDHSVANGIREGGRDCLES